MDSINFRIKLIRKQFCNDSNKEFAKMMGKKENVVNNWVREGYSVGRGVANEIANKFGVDVNWIIPPDGYVPKSDTIVLRGEQNINIAGNSNANIGNQNTNHYGGTSSNKEQPQSTGIPLIPFDCVAGYGADNTGIQLNNCERYNIPDFENIGAEFLVRVSGSSMYPKYSSGDILACKKVHDILFFQWGKIYVIDSSQGQLVKRVFQGENKNMILLVSDNKEKYPPFELPVSDIRSLSIVLGAVRME